MEKIKSLYEKLSEERLDLQNRKELPSWITTSGYQLLKEKYFDPNETFKDRVEIISKLAASYTPDPYTFYLKFYEMIWEGHLSLSTPILASMGKSKGCPVSCASSEIDDSVYGFYDSQLEAAILTKEGFGTSSYLGDIRPRGSTINGIRGKASGVLPVFKDFVQLSRDISQGCYTKDTEILTNKGWKFFRELESDQTILVAAVNNVNQICFEKPIDYIKYRYTGELIRFHNTDNIDIAVTPNHNMVSNIRRRFSNKRNEYGKYISCLKYIDNNSILERADVVKLHRDKYFNNSGFNTSNIKELSDLDRLLIAYQADGASVKNSKSSMRFRFIKQRKIDRLENILNNLNYKYSKSISKDGVTNIYVFKLGFEISKFFKDWVKNISNLDSNYCSQFLKEVLYWDGDQKRTYSTYIKSNIDILQSMCSLCGKKSNLRVLKRNNKKDLYILSYYDKLRFGTETINKSKILYDDYVYCVTVSSGRVIVRSKGKTLVCGNSQRRGAWAGYLPIDHPDFDEILTSISKEPDDANIGWCISDNFINRLNTNDLDAIDRYQKVLKLKMITGKGYFWFPDKVNRQLPNWYKDKNLINKGSNLCVAPETLILTDNGYLTISELDGEEVKIWNGEEFTNTKIFKTGINQKLIKVITSSGQEIECTPYHKFYIIKDYYGKIECVRAIDLKPNDKLIKFELPNPIVGEKILKYPYENGFYSGDGWYDIRSNREGIYLYHEKRKLKYLFFNNELDWYNSEIDNRSSIKTKNLLKPKFFVPTSEYTLESKLLWLAGISDSDGTIAINGSNKSLQIGSINKRFLLDIQLMLQELGITSKVTSNREEGQFLLPDNKGNGDLSLYNCKKSYRLLISSNMLVKLQSLGFKTFRLELGEQSPNRNAEQFIKIIEVLDEGRYDDTYCFTESSKNMGMFNGLLLGNCSEVVPVLQDNETFTCILASLNIAKYDQWRDSSLIFDATVFLHCVALDFINKASKIKGLEKAVEYTRNHMSLGLGALGYATYLQDHSIPFESLDAHFFNINLFKEINLNSILASQWIAKKYGETQITKGYGFGNALRLAIAPNLSSALIAGGVSNGIEPVYKNAYIQSTAAGKVNRVNPSLLKVMKTKKVYSDKLVKDIILNNGSIQWVDWLTDSEKLVFKTAFEIDQKTIIREASVRQRYIDQGQSINLYFSADEKEEYISEVHKLAFEDEYIKGLYYIRSETGVPTNSGECLACGG